MTRIERIDAGLISVDPPNPRHPRPLPKSSSALNDRPGITTLGCHDIKRMYRIYPLHHTDLRPRKAIGRAALLLLLLLVACTPRAMAQEVIASSGRDFYLTL